MSDMVRKDKNGNEMKLYKEVGTHPILEQSIMRLINRNRFFAALIHQMDRKVYIGQGSPVPTAGVNITDKVNLYVSMDYFSDPLKHMREALHVTETGDMSELKKSHQEQIEAVREHFKNKGEEVPQEIEEKLNEPVDWDAKLVEMREKIKVNNYSQTEKDQILASDGKDKLSDQVRDAVLVHECLHIINMHISRAERVSKDIGNGQQFNHQALNIAMDCAINQLCGINDMMRISGGITLESFKKMIEVEDVKPQMEWEYYFNLMKQNSDKLKEKYGENLESMPGHGDDHEAWEEGDGQSEEYTKEVVKGAVKRASEQAQKGAGNLSGDVALLIDKLMKSKVNWKQHLRKFMNKASRFTYEITRSKRNRREPGKGNVLIKAGYKKKYHGKIAVCVDCSGSMSDEDLRRCFSEIAKINMTTNNELIVIEADSSVTQVYEFDPKKPVQIVGRGGTAYQPAFDKAMELDVNGIIYCGDMDAFDTPKKPNNIPVLWAVIGSRQKPPGDFGDVIYIDTESGTEG